MKSHFIEKHLPLLPTPAEADKHFNPSTFKCSYCKVKAEDAPTRRFHLYTSHKEVLKKSHLQDDKYVNKETGVKGRFFLVLDIF